MAAWQPPHLSKMFRIQTVGAGLPAMAAWQLPHLSKMFRIQTVGAGLPAMAAWQPPHLSKMFRIQTVGVSLPAMAAWQPTHPSKMFRIQTVGVSLLAMAAWQLIHFLLVYISVSAVTASYGFALTASPFWQTPQKEPKGLAPPYGSSLGLGVPSLRHCSGGTPRSAIHGRARLARHPCRAAPCATPAFGLLEWGR